MPIEPNGWNTDWNKPDSELTASERAAIRQHTENAVWAARMARGRRSAPGKIPPRANVNAGREAHLAEERRRAAERKRNSEYNMTLGLVVTTAIALSIISLVIGMRLHEVNPTSPLAGMLVAIGTIGCILAVPMIMLAAYLKK